MRLQLITLCLLAALGLSDASEVRKVRDIVIYHDTNFYSAFPSIVRRPNGELLVAFRRAPDRKQFFENYSHTDQKSHLVLVRSYDNGNTWTRDPELIWADPFGGSQDPCLVQLRDDSLLCSSYGWMFLNDKAVANMDPGLRHGNYCFLGGYTVSSKDAGKTWTGPILPPAIPSEITKSPWGKTVPAYNRGNILEGKDGRLYWVVACNTSLKPRRTETHLLVSSDKALTWAYGCPVAQDEKITFNETALYQTPSGTLVAFMRTANFDDHTVIARSRDNGKSFGKWEDAGFQGHPHYPLRLPDKRVLLVYGYRHAPFGIRARVLDAECRDFSSPEIVLRDDGGGFDIGYPWATMISRKEALVVYYFNRNDSTRHIAGTVVRID